MLNPNTQSHLPEEMDDKLRRLFVLGDAKALINLQSERAAVIEQKRLADEADARFTTAEPAIAASYTASDSRRLQALEAVREAFEPETPTQQYETSDENSVFIDIDDKGNYKSLDFIER